MLIFFVIVVAILHESARSPIVEIKNQCITILFVCCHLSKFRAVDVFLHLFLYTVETAIFGFGRGELLLERERAL